MRGDYYDRFKGQLTGGLARVFGKGAFFTNAFQDHFITETAPGHSTMMSGRFPRSTGVVQNDEGVLDAMYPLIGAGGDPASPYRFRGTVLTDWLRVHDPRTRALSVSRKDRAAILPLGRTNQQVYWYSRPSGIFTTSTWYRDSLPAWVREFNARRLPQSYIGKSWTPLLDAGAYTEIDSVAGEHGGRDFMFPHVLSPDTTRAADDVPYFPWMDEITLALALHGLQSLRLGTGPQTDVLAISLSSTDAIGHRYGPDSRELHDQIVRLDRSLAVFFDSLYKLRDSARVIVALTADHGVSANPTVHTHDPNGSARYVLALRDTAIAFRRRVLAAGADSSAFRWDFPILITDTAAFRRARLSHDSVVAAFAKAVRAIPGVLRAETPAQMARRDTTRDVIARRWQHMFPADYPVALGVVLEPFDAWTRADFGLHGSPHDHDAHVPVVFYGPPFKPGRYGAFARVVDIAPTLAEVLGVMPLERLDGRVLRSALRPSW
jgi:predicted AlkP superfamily pyrophosphatase or phosphodiesterase